MDPDSSQGINGHTKPDISTRIKEGLEYKLAGNAHFKEGSYQQSLKSYHFSYNHFQGLDQSSFQTLGPSSQISPDEKRQISCEINAILLNMAACYLKLNKFEKCIVTCDKVIEKDSSNGKAYYRKGEALIKMKKYEGGNLATEMLISGLDILYKAGKLCPQDAMIRTGKTCL